MIEATPASAETVRPFRVRVTARATSGGSPFIIVFFGAHLLLAAVLRASPGAATAHALLTAGIAIWAVLRWTTVGIACVAAYAGGADVLWRMTGAQVPWEISKYLVVFLCAGGLFRLGRDARWNLPALTYIAALVPSILVMMHSYNEDLGELAQRLSFNLSGPLSLFVSAWYTSQLRLSRGDVRTLAVSLVAPVLTVAGITALSTATAARLTFTGDSSAVTSGGFGPNQVSLALGLGALLSFIVAIDPGVRGWQRWAALALVPVFGVQSALTFSRGGLYSFGLALIPAVVLTLRARSSKRGLVLLTVGLTLATATFIVPRLDRFTRGGLSARFSDINPTARDVIVREDLRLWREHPILGVGPGGAPSERRSKSTISHTEYSRLLAEHGVFGLVALIALFTICITVLMKRQGPAERALRVAFLVWSMVSMLHAGMRLAAIGLIFGWACARTIRADADDRQEVPPYSG